MSDKRIDLAEFEDLQSHWKINCTDQYADELFSDWIENRKERIMAELKRCYAKVDALTAALETIAIESSEDEIAKYAEQIIQTTSLY